jgi:hypothetical protein
MSKSSKLIKPHDRTALFTAQFLFAATLAVGWIPPGHAGNDGNLEGGSQMTSSPKRLGAAPVAPLIVNGMRIEAVNAGRKRGLGQNGGYIETFDLASGKAMWLLQVYKIDYAKNMEEDVQDRFIERLESTADGANLLVTDENGNRFEVDLASRKVRVSPADQGRTGIR